jgi:hypothetical protein
MFAIDNPHSCWISTGFSKWILSPVGSPRTPVAMAAMAAMAETGATGATGELTGELIAAIGKAAPPDAVSDMWLCKWVTSKRI